jgi:pimeloyl-ACP methyl ester carboxylesterase
MPLERPYFPIIYVRGYAMTGGEVEHTVADPYMGFNVGSTKLRQQYARRVVRHVFESPLVRLMKDEGYGDSFVDGSELPAHAVPNARAVWIYRYYEDASKELGSGTRHDIETYARGLLALIDELHDRYVPGDRARHGTRSRAFRVYLVAHSMGGLICRCLLQQLSRHDARIDKVFTYATPHGGIDLRGIGNVPGFGFNQSDTFHEDRMREYLSLGADTPVHSLDGAFPEERFFSLVGTNHDDYGLAKYAVGPMSDGLVRIANAYVADTPRAFVHRSHSGHYGIVNSEDGYQNLRRFLFGNVRVDAFLDVQELMLPPAVQEQKDRGHAIRADYLVNVIARVRGARWDLHRRTSDEGSAVLVDYDKHVRARQPLHLASVFLSNAARVDTDRPTLGFSLDIGVQVPEYLVDGVPFWKRDHYDGGYLFRDKVNLEAFFAPDTGWSLRYGWDTHGPNAVQHPAAAENPLPESWVFEVPVMQDTRPGVRAVLRLETRPWNND